jgi:hypothetical protein
LFALHRSPPVLPGLLLLLVLPGCDRYDRGPSGHWEELTRVEAIPGEAFDPAMVDDLPPPARRFLRRAIEPDTPLARRVEVAMEGTLLLDPDRPPLRMEAIQVLAPPEGFVWSARTSGGMMRIRGFDRFSRGEGEMRWKLFGLIPVMRAHGSDVTRSAAARLVMEGVLLPSFLVPRASVEPEVRWEAVDDRHARFRVSLAGEEIVTTVEVDEEGRPLRAWALRWNEGTYERFEVQLSGEVRSGGYRVPSRVVAGWRLGDPDEFRFFEATLTAVEFR